MKFLTFSLALNHDNKLMECYIMGNFVIITSGDEVTFS